MENLFNLYKPETDQSFAGFDWPRIIPRLPKGSLQTRLAKRKKPTVCGPYIMPCVPVQRDNQVAAFYLDSDFQPDLRWQWCDDVAHGINHTGWFVSDFGDGDKIRGMVFRLTGNRGFLIGWSMGDGMISNVHYDAIFKDETEAAYAADALAESTAENDREACRELEQEAA